MKPRWIAIAYHVIFALRWFGIVLFFFILAWLGWQKWLNPGPRPHGILHVGFSNILRDPAALKHQDRYVSDGLLREVALPGRAKTMKGHLAGMPFEVSWASIKPLDPRASVGATIRKLRWKIELPEAYREELSGPLEGTMDALDLGPLSSELVSGKNPSTTERWRFLISWD